MTFEGLIFRSKTTGGDDDVGVDMKRTIPWGDVMEHKINSIKSRVPKLKLVVSKKKKKKKRRATSNVNDEQDAQEDNTKVHLLTFQNRSELVLIKRDIAAHLDRDADAAASSNENDGGEHATTANLLGGLGVSFRSSTLLNESFRSESMNESSGTINRSSSRASTRTRESQEQTSSSRIRVETEAHQYTEVVYRKTPGSLLLTTDGVTFCPKARENKEKQICWSWSNILRHKDNKKTAAVAKLKLTLEDGEDVLFTISSRDELERIRNGISGHWEQKEERQDHRPGEATGLAYPVGARTRDQQSENIPVARATALDGDALSAPSALEAPLSVPTRSDDDIEMQQELSPAEMEAMQQELSPAEIEARRDPAMWSITYQQLMELEEKARNLFGKQKYERATMRDINKRILKPSCKETGVSYALRLNPKGLMIDAFITHAWDEPFAGFVEVCAVLLASANHLLSCLLQVHCPKANSSIPPTFFPEVSQACFPYNDAQTQPVDMRNWAVSGRHNGHRAADWNPVWRFSCGFTLCTGSL